MYFLRINLKLENLYAMFFFQDEPWSYLETDPETGEEKWVGYCVDLAHKLAEMMKFDFEFSKPQVGVYGEKQKNGKWDGLVGDLARGVSIGRTKQLTEFSNLRKIVLGFFCRFSYR